MKFLTTKKRILLAGIFIIVAAAGSYTYYVKKGVGSGASDKSKISYYTCPMHPHIHEDKPGNCPICQMKLVPVYEQEAAPKEMGGSLGVSISEERQQLIGIKTGPVVKKQVVKEIRTAGRVAFDPDLAVAQREFLEIAKNVPSLKKAATSRLTLLGMSEEEIRELQKRGEADHRLFLPEPGEAVWVYAPLYENEIPFVKIGASVAVTGPGLMEAMPGTVRAIDPVLDPMTRSARARIEVPGLGGKVKPESYLTALISVDLGEQVAVPQSAVIDTGARQIVFVVNEGKHFEAREVTLGAEAGDDRVILSGLAEGEIIATSGTFLIDSESQLKAAVSGKASVPSCPEGQVWDLGMSMCMPRT